MQFSTLIKNFKTSGKFDLSAYHDVLGTEQFINHIKNSVPAVPEEYYRDFCFELSRTIEEKEVFKNKNAWQLVYITNECFFGQDIAIQNLRELAFSLHDSWATYIYARNCFIFGKTLEGAEVIAHAFSRGSTDKKLSSVLYTIPFFKGNTSYYRSNSLFLETNDSFYANIDARMSFTARNFDQVIKITSKTNDTSSYTKNLAARSLFNNQYIKDEPIQNLPILVIGDKNKKNQGRLLRFAQNCAELNLEYTIIDNFKAPLPLHVKRALWRKGVENTHLTKATGASIAHASAWSSLLETNAAGAIICEDDCIFAYNPFHALRDEDIHGNNIVFLNNRIANIEPPDEYNGIIYRDARTVFDASPRTIGADCYYIPKTVAKTALETIEKTGFPAVIDLYLLKVGPDESKFGSICVDPAPGEHADEAYAFV